jgi:predicted CoA-binding protein
MPLSRDDDMRALLTGVRRIAMVGASAKPDRPSYGVMRFLLDHGWHVIPVNPGLAGQSILGQTVVASLSEIDPPVDMVDIFRNSEAAAGAVDEAIAHRARAVWLQLGVINPVAAARAESAGLEVVMDRCPKIEIRRLAIRGPA